MEVIVNGGPDWLNITQTPNDAHRAGYTTVKWWLPSYWLAVWDALTNKHYRRYNHKKGYRYVTGWYTVMLMDHLSRALEGEDFHNA